MSDVTVAQFAEVLKVPVDRLLVQLESAGIQVAGPQALISDEAKLELLTHLRRAHGADEPSKTAGAAAPRKITLARKSQSELKQASTQGRARTVNVEVRHKKTYIKRDVLEEQNKQTQGAADEKRKEQEAQEQAERERQEAARKESERMEAENRRRIEDEATKKKQAEEARRAAGRSARQAGNRSAAPRRRGSRRPRPPRVPSATSPRRRPWSAAGPGQGHALRPPGTARRRRRRRAQQEEEARQGTHGHRQRRRRSRATRSKCPPRRSSAKSPSARPSRRRKSRRRWR